uniref:Reverse transcriptase domain-containing protein n=1 Tax=Micrurus spixii TaxID=129469 RepID=A0A2D4ML09_9SAUR
MDHKLKKEKERKTIKTLQDENEIPHHLAEEKQSIAQKYFAALYTQDEIPEERIKQYLNEKKLPTIPDLTKEMLNVEITMTEMKEAISKQKCNKSPGPDGIPAELYKEIQTPLEQLMLDLYNKTLEQAKLPNSWTEAYITLILKENTNDSRYKTADQFHYLMWITKYSLE